ncbi:yecA family protein [Alteromonas mediterranea MED64]|mgnify:FL=1|jgi:uncharacterized protein|nr:UPF0149 family protein [Alteromonas mediterranea]AGP82952.1 yecA family protein [Alteromonas mediterranea MED64]MBR9896008.1 YecA family protein [Gammaproteobacteria bacterium]HBL22319.1 hypothetical protein [Alteromonas mediterranea]|tara:strand:+ start:179 stop:880 length:702 start_codon:yes stop_codon:yes gene_type:complete
MVNDGFPINTISDIVSLPSLREVLPSPHHIDGMIFAVASAPEIPMPEQWMPWLIQSSNSQLVDKDVDKLADALMNGLRAHLDFMRQEKSPLPCELLKTLEIEGSAYPSPALENWLNGLLQVHKQLEPVWEDAWQHLEKNSTASKEVPPDDKPASSEQAEPAEARLSRCLKLFSTLANVELALSYRNEKQAKELKGNMGLLVKQLPSVLADYTNLSGELASSLPNQFEMYTKIT